MLLLVFIAQYLIVGSGFSCTGICDKDIKVKMPLKRSGGGVEFVIAVFLRVCFARRHSNSNGAANKKWLSDRSIQIGTQNQVSEVRCSFQSN